MDTDSGEHALAHCCNATQAKGFPWSPEPAGLGVEALQLALPLLETELVQHRFWARTGRAWVIAACQLAAS